MANNREYIGTSDFLDILNSGGLSLYMQKLVMQRFPLLNWFNLKPTQNGNKFDVVVSEPSIQDEIDRNGVSQGSEASDFPNLRFGEGEWAVKETSEYKESFQYSTLVRNTQLDKVRKWATKAAAVLGNHLNNESTDILFNSAGITGANMDWTVNPGEEMNNLVNKIDDLSFGFIPDTMFVRAEKYNSLSAWLSNAGMGIAYVNPADRAETRVSSYIGINETNLAIKNVYKLPAVTKGIPNNVDYVAFDSRAEVGFLYNALNYYEVPTELSSYTPGFYQIDAENQFVLAFENMVNTNPSQFRTFLLAAAKLGILEPNAIVTGQITADPVTMKQEVKSKK